MTEDSITTLIEALKNGDSLASQELWSRYFERVVAIARQRMSPAVRRTYDEEDAAISVFDSLCKGAERGNFAQLTDRHDLWVLLLAITRQKTVDRVRHETRQKRGGGKVRGESALNLPDIRGIGQLVADDPTPESIAALDDQYQRLLEALPDDTMRSIVELRLNGYTAKQIAGRFGYTTRWAERKLEFIRSTWAKTLEPGP